MYSHSKPVNVAIELIPQAPHAHNYAQSYALKSTLYLSPRSSSRAAGGTPGVPMYGRLLFPVSSTFLGIQRQWVEEKNSCDKSV